jgi:hypothetical protein
VPILGAIDRKVRLRVGAARRALRTSGCTVEVQLARQLPLGPDPERGAKWVASSVERVLFEEGPRVGGSVDVEGGVAFTSARRSARGEPGHE